MGPSLFFGRKGGTAMSSGTSSLSFSSRTKRRSVAKLSKTSEGTATTHNNQDSYRSSTTSQLLLQVEDFPACLSNDKGDGERASSRDLNRRFQLKVRESSQRRDSLILQTKLNEHSITLNKLYFGDDEDDTDAGFVGREQELKKLHSIFENFVSEEECENPQSSTTQASSLSPPSCVVSVTGTTGTGKTALTKKLKRSVLKAEGYFCMGKFDMSASKEHGGGGAHPYTAFAAVSHDLGNQLLQRTEAFESELIRERLHIAVGDAGIKLLLQVFPGLLRFFQAGSDIDLGMLASSSNSASNNIMERKTNQLHYTVRQLFRIVSSKDSPLVLVLDDIQWADEPSLDLIEILLKDRETTFLLIATYRSDEIPEDHPFLKTLTKLKEPQDFEGKKVHMENISVGNLSETDVRSIVASALRESDDYVKSLAEMVYEKTLGNPFFVVQLLQTLANDQLLTFNLGLMKWMWQEGDIQALTVSDNVGCLLARRIQSLSEPSTKMVLKVAACLGQGFEGDTMLASLIALVEAQLLDATAVETVHQGIRQCIESNLLEISGTTYNFVHDQIKRAAFELIPKEELPRMQLEIGRGLLKYASPEEVTPSSTGSLEDENGIFFLAIDLCNRGSAHISDKRWLLGLAWKCAEAADKAAQKSAFHASVSYAKSGLQHLEEYESRAQNGENHQQIPIIRLRLHVILAETSFCIGDSCATEEYAEIIIASDFSFNDKFEGYVARMLSQFAQQKLGEALETSVFILKQLGFIKNLSSKPGPLRVLAEIVKTKNLMKSYSQDDLMNLPRMMDQKRLRAINIIYRSSYVFHSTNPNLFLILFLMATRWTVKYGVSKFSPPILSIYGLVVCGVLEDFDTGSMIGEVALALSERLQATQTIASTTSIVFSFVYHWNKDLRSARKPLEYGLQTGLQAGDVNNAIAIIMMLDQSSYMSGYHNLKELSATFKESVTKIRTFGQESFAVEHCIVWQVVLNLQGKADDPFVLTGEAMNEEEAKKKATETNQKMVFTSINSWSGIMGYLFENHEFAVSRMKRVNYKDCLGYVSMPRHFSFLALGYVALALEGIKVKENLRNARNIRNKMLKKWAAPGNINIHHLVILFDAEIASTKNPDIAAGLYEEAIRVASRAGFRNDKATAHARAARFFFFVQNNVHSGSYHLDKAVQAYCEWGATAVAKTLMTLYGNTALPSSLRGLSQMSDEMKDVMGVSVLGLE